MTKEDYWGNLTVETPTDPHTKLLEEQVANLKNKTKNLLTGSIASQTIGDHIRTTLAIVAPKLDYRFDLVSIYFPLDTEGHYPIEIKNDLANKTSKYQNEEAFKNRLREILSSPQTTSSLQKLLNASQRTHRT